MSTLALLTKIGFFLLRDPGWTRTSDLRFSTGALPTELQDYAGNHQKTLSRYACQGNRTDGVPLREPHRLWLVRASLHLGTYGAADAGNILCYASLPSKVRPLHATICRLETGVFSPFSRTPDNRIGSFRLEANAVAPSPC